MGHECNSCRFGYSAKDSSEEGAGVLCVVDSPSVNPFAPIIVKQLAVNTFTISAETISEHSGEEIDDKEKCNFRYTFPIKPFMTNIVGRKACLKQWKFVLNGIESTNVKEMCLAQTEADSGCWDDDDVDCSSVDVTICDAGGDDNPNEEVQCEKCPLGYKKDLEDNRFCNTDQKASSSNTDFMCIQSIIDDSGAEVCTLCNQLLENGKCKQIDRKLVNKNCLAFERNGIENRCLLCNEGFWPEDDTVDAKCVKKNLNGAADDNLITNCLIHDNRLSKSWKNYVTEFAENGSDDVPYNSDVIDFIKSDKFEPPRQMKKQCFLCDPGYVYSISSRRCVGRSGQYGDWTGNFGTFEIAKTSIDGVLDGCAQVALDPSDYGQLSEEAAYLHAVHCHECIPTLTKALVKIEDQDVFRCEQYDTSVVLEDESFSSYIEPLHSLAQVGNPQEQLLDTAGSDSDIEAELQAEIKEAIRIAKAAENKWGKKSEAADEPENDILLETVRNIQELFNKIGKIDLKSSDPSVKADSENAAKLTLITKYMTLLSDAGQVTDFDAEDANSSSVRDDQVLTYSSNLISRKCLAGHSTDTFKSLLFKIEDNTGEGSKADINVPVANARIEWVPTSGNADDGYKMNYELINMEGETKWSNRQSFLEWCHIHPGYEFDLTTFLNEKGEMEKLQIWWMKKTSNMTAMQTPSIRLMPYKYTWMGHNLMFKQAELTDKNPNQTVLKADGTEESLDLIKPIPEPETPEPETPSVDTPSVDTPPAPTPPGGKRNLSMENDKVAEQAEITTESEERNRKLEVTLGKFAMTYKKSQLVGAQNVLIDAKLATDLQTSEDDVNYEGFTFAAKNWDLFKMGDWRQADDDSWSQSSYNYDWYIANKFGGLPINSSQDSKIGGLRNKIKLDECAWYSGYNICPLYWWLNIPMKMVGKPIKDPATFSFGAKPEPVFNQEFNIGDNNNQDSANSDADCLYEKVGNQWVGGFDYGTYNRGLKIKIESKWKLPKENSCLFLQQTNSAKANYVKTAEETDEASEETPSKLEKDEKSSETPSLDEHED